MKFLSSIMSVIKVMLLIKNINQLDFLKKRTNFYTATKEDMNDILQYVRDSELEESTWPNLSSWLNWHEEHNFLGIIKDEKKILGMAIARPIDYSEPIEYYNYNLNADCIYVDLTITFIKDRYNLPRSLGMKCLLSILKDRFGNRKNIIFNRKATENEKIYDYAKFMKKALI
jgi:hypothetical protein